MPKFNIGDRVRVRDYYDLTEEERARRMKEISVAAGKLLSSKGN